MTATATRNATIGSYTDAIDALPDEAFLGSLVFFSISKADVNLDNARRDLAAVGLSTDTLRKNLRPIDAFKKASNTFKKKFNRADDVRAEIMVREVGEDGDQSYRHLVREHSTMKAGQRRRLVYDKVGEITFTRGTKDKVSGEYVGHGVEVRRMTDHLTTPLTLDEDQHLTETLVTFQDHYDHLLRYMDSHAVRTFVREYIYGLKGICVKESGGLYFVSQENAKQIEALAEWVRSVGSEFHIVPLLNVAEQKAMIMEAFEDETVEEVERLMDELQKILAQPGREIEQRTFDAYAEKAAELKQKVAEYQKMLGSRADTAAAQIGIYMQQVFALTDRIRQPKRVSN